MEQKTGIRALEPPSDREGVRYLARRSEAAWRGRIPPVGWVAYHLGGGSQVATPTETSRFIRGGLHENEHVTSPH